jgi:hypothetical protein
MIKTIPAILSAFISSPEMDKRLVVARLPDAYCGHGAKEPEGGQQPKHHEDDDHHIQDLLDGSIHRNVIVDQPQNDSDDDQDNDQINQIHLYSPVMVDERSGRTSI